MESFENCKLNLFVFERVVGIGRWRYWWKWRIVRMFREVID